MTNVRSLVLALVASMLGGCSGSPAASSAAPPFSVHPPVAVVSAIAPIGKATARAPLPDLLRVNNTIREKGWRDTRDEPSNKADLCEVANSNIRAAVDAVLAQPVPAGNAQQTKAWDRKTAPAFQKLVDGRYALTRAERAFIAKSGFVVPERLIQSSYAHAYHDVFQSQLPVYITMDSLFHAVFKAHESLMVHVEENLLAPRVHLLVMRLRDTLAKRGTSLPADVRKDLDVYLAVAATLISVSVHFDEETDVDGDVAALVERIERANEFVAIDLFGRKRMVDFSQYRPRGHYATHSQLIPYFKTVMWLSRLELNLVSRSSSSSAPGMAPDPRETPREAMMAVALAQLVEDAQMSDTLAEIEDAMQTLGGRREDVGAPALLSMHRRAGGGKLDDAHTFDTMKGEIGTGFVRTARLHYMPQGSTDLPVIFTLLGARVTPDTAAMRPLVHDETPNRFDVHAADIAYALGHDQARDLLRDDLARFPTLSSQLDRARRAMSDIRGDDLYTTWLLAIRDLSWEVPARAPSFMRTKPFRDLRINSTVAAYGQLRRNNVLIAGQGYDEGGCEIPDGYVEPAPEVLDRLILFTKRASALLSRLEQARSTRSMESDSDHLPALFARMTRIFEALRRIVDREIAGEPLTEPERRLLATVAEIVPATSASPPMHTGWYFQLFESRRTALETPSFIGDFHTSTNSGQVAYAGAGDPVLGIFVVDAGGPPRLMVGPVARAYELHAPLSQRLTDDEGRLLPGKVSPWASSYSVKAVSAPSLRFNDITQDDERSRHIRFYEVRGLQRIGDIKVEFLTHHRQPCGEGHATIAGMVGKLRVTMGKENKDDACDGGYRITMGGQVFPVEMRGTLPEFSGLGDPWDPKFNED